MAPKLAAAPRIWTGQPRVGDGIPKNRERARGLYRIWRIYLPQCKIREREERSGEQTPPEVCSSKDKVRTGLWRLAAG